MLLCPLFPFARFPSLLDRPLETPDTAAHLK